MPRNIIGHPEALRELHEESGWQYADPMNQRMCEVLQFFGNTNLVELDEFIERMETDGLRHGMQIVMIYDIREIKCGGKGVGSVLREMRRDALRLFVGKFFGQVCVMENISDYAFFLHVEAIYHYKRMVDRLESVK